MPIYAYEPRDENNACEYCADGFDRRQAMSDAPLAKCPQCGAAVIRVFAPFCQGESKTGFDRKAKEKGFHKLKRRDKGTYEKLY